MTTLTKEQIKEIAEQLDCGFRPFCNKQNGELLFIPDTLKHPDMETEAWAEEMDKLDNNFADYIEINQLESSDSFEIMVQFANTLSDTNKLKNKLKYALNKKKPFREFKFIIDNSGEFRQMWFDFKSQKTQKWVQDKFNQINEL